MSPNIFFDNWTGVLRVMLIGTLAYLSLICLLRMSGKRTLSKMNAFDLIVTVAFGSTLATALLSKDVSLAEGVTAFALLIALQYIVTWSSVRFPFVDKLVKADPTLLYFRGRMLHGALKRERVTESEIHAAVRNQGLGGLDEVEAVVLETEGNVTVITTAKPGSLAALESLHNYDEAKDKT